MKKFEVEFNGFIPLSLIAEANDKENAIAVAVTKLNNTYTPEMVVSVTETK